MSRRTRRTSRRCLKLEPLESRILLSVTTTALPAADAFPFINGAQWNYNLAASGKTGTGGTAENPAGVPAKPVPDAALPQNHTGKITAAQQAKMIKQQQDLMRKKQAQREKAAKQAEEERAKKNKKKKVTTAPPSPQPPPQPQPADAGGSTIKQ